MANEELSASILTITANAALQRWEASGHEVSAEVIDILRGCATAGVDLDLIDVEQLASVEGVLQSLRGDHPEVVRPRRLWDSLYALVRIGPANNASRIRWRGQVSDICRIVGFDLMPVSRTDAEVIEAGLAMLIDHLDQELETAIRPGRRRCIDREIGRAKRLLAESVAIREVVS